MKYFLLSLPLFLTACTSGNQSKDDAQTPATENTEVNNAGQQDTESFTGCYMRVLQRDTLAAHLTQKGNNITGRLSFDNFEKDGSQGPVSGRIEGDIIRLFYSFQSEGMSSVSEVYFKRTANGIIHGFGEVDVRGDTAFYSAPAALNYPADDVLRKIPCDSLPAKYR